MSRAVKILLGIAGVAVLLILALLIGGFLYLQANRERLAADGSTLLREGAHFGSGRDAQACLDEALRRLEAASDILDEARNKAWLAACLKTAAVSTGFCGDIPPRQEIWASATWAAQRCEKAGRKGQQPCARLIGAVQERCLAAPR